MLANLAVKKELLKEVTDRQFTSNEMEKVLELQSSSLFRRRVPSFPFPDYPTFAHPGLGLYQEDIDTVHAEEQQKILQNLLKHYQKSLMDDWRASAAAQHLPKKKEPCEVEEPKEEPKLKRGRRDDEGKSFSKQRKTNFTANEVEALLNCVRGMKDVILFGVAGGRGWARAWQDIAKIVTKVEGIDRSEGDVRKKWTYLKWEAKNTSKPGRDPVSKQVLNILTSRDREVQEAMTMRGQPEKQEQQEVKRSEPEETQKGKRQHGKLRELYEQVSTYMEDEKGYRKTGGQCKVKWKHMRASFLEAVKKQDRNICPIYFEQLYYMLEGYIDEKTRRVAQTMLVKGHGRQGQFSGNPTNTRVLILNRIAKAGAKPGKKSLAVKLRDLKMKPSDSTSADSASSSVSNVSAVGTVAKVPLPLKGLKFILPKGGPGLMMGPMRVAVKMERSDADIEIKEEPITYTPDQQAGGSEGTRPAICVPPAHAGVQSPLQPVPNAGQLTPQPSPPPMAPRKQSLPPLAPKPPGVKQLTGGAAPAAKPPPKLLPKPSSPPEVCLRWNSYHSNMQNTFPSLLNNEQFVDVTLACDGRSIKCHKVMLSACSPYMEELLSSNPCQHPIILLKDMKFWQLQALVDFMYRGEVNVTQDKLPSLLSAAEALQIKGLASPVNHSGPPKITQVQTLATPAHDMVADDLDQVSYMRQLQLQSDIKAEYEEEYMQDTDESQPPTPRPKKRKLVHNTTPSNGTLVKKSPGSVKKKERHTEPSTSHSANMAAQVSGHGEHKRPRDSDKTTLDGNAKNFVENQRHQTNQDEDLDIDEEQAQIILERYSSQNEEYSREDMDDNSTTSG